MPLDKQPTAALQMSPAMAAPPNRRKEAPDADAFWAAATSGSRGRYRNRIAERPPRAKLDATFSGFIPE
jgi:hypothetical protein